MKTLNNLINGNVKTQNTVFIVGFIALIIIATVLQLTGIITIKFN